MKVHALWLCFAVFAAFGQSSPERMTKLIVRLQSPDVPENSFAAQPKTMYRSGDRYCRIEEVPDAEHGIHGLVIISEPDIWLINLLPKTAAHHVDPGPTFNCHLPIFPDVETKTSAANTSNPTNALEFGRELTYFQGQGATAGPGPVLQGRATKAYTLAIGDSQFVLFIGDAPERPIAVLRQRGEKREVYWYSAYEELAFDAEVFAKPKDVKIEDAR